MFRIECYTDDKRLAAVHRALNGLVYDLKSVLVTHAEPDKKTGKLKSTAPEGGITANIRGFLGARKSTTVSSLDIQESIVKAGWNKTSHYPVISALLKEKSLVRTKTKGIYKINRRKL